MSLALNEEALTLLFVGRLLVAVVSKFLSKTKEKSQQNQPLAFTVSNKLLTINIYKINDIYCIDYFLIVIFPYLLKHSIVEIIM